MLSAQTTPMGYGATRQDDGTLTIHRVPIFVECERNEVQFDAAWISKAVATAQRNEREGYMAPLHIRHHEPATEANDSVRAAGYFRVLGTEPITFRGASRLAVLADLIVTDPATQAEILSKRLPYRSVEIFNVEEPAFDGLALLDHEAPFLELPMLMVSEVREGTAAFQMSARDGVACFQKDKHASVLFAVDNPTEKPMSEEQKLFKDDPEEEKSENMAEGEGGGIDAAAVIAAIEDGSISLADFEAITAAMEARKAAASEPEEEPADEEVAPAPIPGAEVMRAKPDPELASQFARLQGENDALKARLDAKDAEEQRTAEVGEAMSRLKDRPLGSDLKERLVNFHKTHGADAFKDYVDSLEQTSAILGTVDPRTMTFAKHDAKVPEVALTYQDRGVDAVDQAARFCREWEALQSSGIRTSQENYVRHNMTKILEN